MKNDAATKPVLEKRDRATYGAAQPKQTALQVAAVCSEFGRGH